eukprot:m.106927 g.106927  ORF g.106927 m.106927 type:complete len:274 (-) comp13312_c1_seq6:652-1473(-)
MFQFSLFHPPATNNLSILFATLSFITQIAKPEQAVFDLLFDDTRVSVFGGLNRATVAMSSVDEIAALKERVAQLQRENEQLRLKKSQVAATAEAADTILTPPESDGDGEDRDGVDDGDSDSDALNSSMMLDALDDIPLDDEEYVGSEEDSWLYVSPHKPRGSHVSAHEWLASERARDNLASVAEKLSFALHSNGSGKESPLNRSLDIAGMRQQQLAAAASKLCDVNCGKAKGELSKAGCVLNLIHVQVYISDALLCFTLNSVRFAPFTDLACL